MSNSEQFPEPLSDDAYEKRMENAHAPFPTNLTGKGYLEFQQPQGETEFWLIKNRGKDVLRSRIG